MDKALSAIEKMPGNRLPEFPLAHYSADGTLLNGFADLVSVADEVWVVDYKTDTPASGGAASLPPHYVEQVRLYTKAITSSNAFGAKKVKGALLYTATGQLIECVK